MTDSYKPYDGAHSAQNDSTKDVAKDQAAGVASDAKDRGREVAGEAKQQAGQVAGEAKQRAGEVADEAKLRAGEVAGEAQAHAKDLFSQARHEAYSTAGTQQQRIAQSLHTLGDEFGAMAAGSRESDANSGTATRIGQIAADRIGGLGDWLERREPADVLDEVTRYARRNPGSFLLAAGVVGLLAGRITRSLRDDSQDEDAPRGERRYDRRTEYGRGGYGHRTQSDYSTHNLDSAVPSSYYPDAYQGQHGQQGQQAAAPQGQPGQVTPEFRGTAAERTPVAGESVEDRLNNAGTPEQPGNTYPASGRGL